MTKFDLEKLRHLNSQSPVRQEDFYDANKNTIELVPFFMKKAWISAEFATYNHPFADFYASEAADILEDLERFLKLTKDLERAIESGDKLAIADARYYIYSFQDFSHNLGWVGPTWRRYRQKLRRLMKYWRRKGLAAQRELRAQGLCVHCRQKIETPKGAWKFACPLCQGLNYAMR